MGFNKRKMEGLAPAGCHRISAGPAECSLDLSLILDGCNLTAGGCFHGPRPSQSFGPVRPSRLRRGLFLCRALSCVRDASIVTDRVLFATII
jgi:hypothetical protein